MSSAGTNGTDGTDLTTTLTTQGDIVYRDASGLARLGAGTSGQVLQTGGTGANPSWVDASGGTVLRQWTKMFAGISAISGSITTPTAVTGYTTSTMTPQSTSSKFLIQWTVAGNNSDHTFFQVIRNVGGTLTRVGLGSPNLRNGTDYSDTGSTSFDNDATNAYPVKTIQMLDAPNTTSNVYYQLYTTQHGGTFYFGRSRLNPSTDQYTALNSVNVFELDGSNSTLVHDTNY
jgi:hypothetical protein